MTVLQEIIAKIGRQPKMIKVGDVTVQNHSISDIVAAIGNGATGDVMASADPTDEKSLPGITFRKVVPV